MVRVTGGGGGPRGRQRDSLKTGVGIRIRRRCLRRGSEITKKGRWMEEKGARRGPRPRRRLFRATNPGLIGSGEKWRGNWDPQPKRKVGSSRKGKQCTSSAPGTGLAAGTGTGAVAGEKGVYIPSWGRRAVPGYTFNSRNWRPPLVGRQWSRVCEVAPDQLTAQSLGISTPV